MNSLTPKTAAADLMPPLDASAASQIAYRVGFSSTGVPTVVDPVAEWLKDDCPICTFPLWDQADGETLEEAKVNLGIWSGCPNNHIFHKDCIKACYKGTCCPTCRNQPCDLQK